MARRKTRPGWRCTAALLILTVCVSVSCRPSQEAQVAEQWERHRQIVAEQERAKQQWEALKQRTKIAVAKDNRAAMPQLSREYVPLQRDWFGTTGIEARPIVEGGWFPIALEAVRQGKEPLLRWMIGQHHISGSEAAMAAAVALDHKLLEKLGREGIHAGKEHGSVPYKVWQGFWMNTLHGEAKRVALKETLKILLSEGHPIEGDGKSALSLLSLALTGSPDVENRADDWVFAETLIDLGTDIKQASLDAQDTVLHVAVSAEIPDRAKVLQKLLDKGAFVSAVNKNGYTALHSAALSSGYGGDGCRVSVPLLAKAGLDVNAANGKGDSALHIAARGAHADQKEEPEQVQCMEALLAAGADPNAKNGKGDTPLHIAAASLVRKNIVLLLEHGADPTVLNEKNQTPRDTFQRNAAEKKFQSAQPVRFQELLALFDRAKPPAHDPQPAAVATASPAVTSEPVVAAAVAVPAVSKIDFGRYHALVIGNDRYADLPKLKTAGADAKAVAALLQRRFGFRVQLLLDATRSQILVALSAYRTSLGPKDNLLIYYAGHGWLDSDADEGYWLPVDATRDNNANWISNATITSAVRTLQAKHVMVVADSCFSGKITRGLKLTQRTPNYLERISKKKARVVLASGGVEPVADGGGSGHSIFAAAFLNALQGTHAAIDGTRLFDAIRRPVVLNSDQTPEYADIHKAGHDGGDFIFVPIQ